MLSVQDGVETDSQLYLATEPALPLVEWLAKLDAESDEKEVQHENAKILGVYRVGILSWTYCSHMFIPLYCSHQLLRALEFLNERCKIIVGGLSVHSVFLTQVYPSHTHTRKTFLRLLLVACFRVIFGSSADLIWWVSRKLSISLPYHKCTRPFARRPPCISQSIHTHLSIHVFLLVHLLTKQFVSHPELRTNDQ